MDDSETFSNIYLPSFSCPLLIHTRRINFQIKLLTGIDSLVTFLFIINVFVEVFYSFLQSLNSRYLVFTLLSNVLFFRAVLY